MTGGWGGLTGGEGWVSDELPDGLVSWIDG